MRGRVVATWLLSSGCAASVPQLEPSTPVETSTERAAAPQHPQAESRELYRLAEDEFADEDYEDAVALMSQALAAMPDDVSSELRHRLEARLTFMQLTAWQKTEDVEFVIEARQRLYQQLEEFPVVVASLSPEQAEVVRDNLFEQLHDVEAQLEPYLDDTPEEEAEALEVLTAAAEAKAAEPEVTATSRHRRGKNGEEIREIEVKRHRRAATDDPEALARARGAFSVAGPVLTRGPDLVHGPRGLVRTIEATDDGKGRSLSRARRFVRAHKTELTRCYDEAFARNAVYALQLEVRLELVDGQVRSAVVEQGALIDREGDECLTEALRAAGGYADREDQLLSGEAAVRMLFFWEPAVFINGSTGEFFSPGQSPTKPSEPDPVEDNAMPRMPAY